MPIRPVLLTGILFLYVLPSAGFTATFTVDLDLDLVDAIPGDGACDVGNAVPPGMPRCSLRAAVMEAEATPGADTIVLPEGGDFALTLTGLGGSQVGDLNVSTEITILGFLGNEPPLNPALLPVINATAINDAHFDVLNGQLTLRGLVLTGGSPDAPGGALQVLGNDSSIATVEHVLFRFNTAPLGGAISTTGSARAIVSDSHFFRNDATAGNGAAIYLDQNSSAEVHRSSFVDNRTTSVGTTIAQSGNSSLRLHDSTLDGTPLRPATPGLEARIGLIMGGSSSLVVRNSTITNYASTALYLPTLDGDEYVRIAHSVLEADGDACEAFGIGIADADVQIAYSIVESESNCHGFYRTVVYPGAAELEPLNLDDPPRLTFSRRPSGPLANVVDAGLPIGAPAADPEFFCTNVDQLGRTRPADADLDERFSCDFGAIEQPPPEPFVVDHFADDLVDELPGDGLCATPDTPGIGVVCTLRAAVMEAEALPGLQQIRFATSTTPVVLTLPGTDPAGGALEITDTVAIDGNLVAGRPTTTIRGQMPAERLFRIEAPDVPVYLRNLRLTGGETPGAGGAMALLPNSIVELSRSVLFDNEAANGGGAIAVHSGELTLRDSDLHANRSDFDALALFANFDSDIVIHNSSFRDHVGFDLSGAPQAALDVDPDARMRVYNSSFIANQIAVRADNPHLLVMQQTTLANQLSGGVVADLGATSQFALVNSIVSGSGAGSIDCTLTGSGIAQFFQIDHVLDSDGSCAQFADDLGLTADPRLLPLDRPTGRISYRMRPSPYADALSPALDAASITSCILRSDQYGQPRPVDLLAVPNANGPCDLGAIEAQVFDQLFDDSFESAG